MYKCDTFNQTLSIFIFTRAQKSQGSPLKTTHHKENHAKKSHKIWTIFELVMDFTRSCIENEMKLKKEKEIMKINWNNGKSVILSHATKTASLLINALARCEWLEVAGNRIQTQAKENKDQTCSWKCSWARTSRKFQKLMMNIFSLKLANYTSLEPAKHVHHGYVIGLT